MPHERTRFGDWGEEYARRFLEKKGYSIIEAKYRGKYGEVDIVAWDGDCLVFVEVKSRRTRAFGRPEESVTAGEAAEAGAVGARVCSGEGLRGEGVAYRRGGDRGGRGSASGAVDTECGGVGGGVGVGILQRRSMLRMSGSVDALRRKVGVLPRGASG